MSDQRQRRFIRLKEWGPHLDMMMRPSDAYIAGTDGSLVAADFRLRTDTDGFIVGPDRVDTAVPADRDGRVVVFGDSLVESVYVHEGERFVAQAESRLAGQGLHIRCANAGYSGSTSLQLVQAMIAKLGRRPPSAVMLVAPVSDAFVLIRERGYWCFGDKRFSPVVPHTNTDDKEVPFAADDLKAVLPIFIAACRSMGHWPMLATHVHRQAPYAGDAWLRRRFKKASNCVKLQAARRGCNAAVRQAAAAHAVPCWDLEAQAAQHHDWLYDDMHLNALGSAQAAVHFADFLTHHIEPIRSISGRKSG